MNPLTLPGRACSPTCSSLQAVARDRLILSTAASCLRASRISSPFLYRHQHPQLHSSFRIDSRRTFHSTSSLKSDSPSRISYRVAVSSSGKGRRFHPVKNAYNFNPDIQDALGLVKDKTQAVRRKSRPDSGEDAFFVSKVGREDPGPVAFAVTDGVGGWTESKVDPADFSHGLCSYMAESALAWEESPEKLRAKNLLQMGYDQVVADDGIRAGGSTASVGVALNDGRVELANLGDSGSVLLRLAAVHHYSVPQTHGFNTPYQLSIIPPRMRAQASIFGGAYLEDFPRDASVTNVRMQHGDVLLLATDGVFDNLNNQDILKIITNRMVLTGAWTATPERIAVSGDLQKLTSPGGLASLLPPPPPPPSEHDDSSKQNPTSPDQTYALQSLLAASVAREAKMASMDLRRDGPFAKEAQRYYPGDYYRGGKVDDICVLAIVAVEEGQGQGH